LQNSIIDLNFIVDPKLMNKKHYSFWLRFIFFFFVFAVAFFLMVFVVDTNPSSGFRMLLIYTKICWQIFFDTLTGEAYFSLSTMQNISILSIKPQLSPRLFTYVST